MFRFALDRFIYTAGEVFLLLIAFLVIAAVAFEAVRPVLSA
jgi:hypothetical protein